MEDEKCRDYRRHLSTYLFRLRLVWRILPLFAIHGRLVGYDPTADKRE